MSTTMSTPYCTAEQADAYNATRLNHTAWTEASEDNRTRALYDASDLIDTLNYAGVAAGTGRQFPRENQSDVPDNVIKACFELAYALLDGADPELEMESAFQQARAFEAVRIVKQQAVHPRILHGIVSMKAWILLKPYLRDPNAITLTRV